MAQLTAQSSPPQPGAGQPAESPEDVVARLRRTFADGRTRDPAWRLRQLRALVALLDDGGQALSEAIVGDLGRDPLQASMLDLGPVRAEAQFAIKHLSRWLRPRRVRTGVAAQPGRSQVRYEPRGVALVISPWNYPVNLALTPLVSALAAGTCVVLKPSETTPRVSARLAELVSRHLDPDAVVVVEGDAETTQALLAQGVDHCFFTGSPEVGREVMRAAAEHLTPVTLELGGKCPAVVTGSARLDVAARRIIWGKLVNSGQTCVAPDHVLVDRSVRDELVGHMRVALRRFQATGPLPLVHEGRADAVAELLDGAGGEIVIGGSVERAAARADLTVVVDPDPGSAVLREEIFGPLLPVVAVDDLGQAIGRIEAGDHPLAAYVFTEDREEQDRFVREVSAGGVVVNHVMLHLSVPQLPFGGVGRSGMGNYHGRWGFEAFSHAKAVLRARTWPEVSLVYPPYEGLKRRLIELM